MTKNCVSLVFTPWDAFDSDVLTPALAIASWYVPVKASDWTFSFKNGVFGCPLLPVPLVFGAPACTMSSLAVGKPLSIRVKFLPV